MIIAKVAAGHVPMEVLGLDIQAKHVCQQLSQRTGHFRYRFAGQSESNGTNRYSLSHSLVLLSLLGSKLSIRFSFSGVAPKVTEARRAANRCMSLRTGSRQLLRPRTSTLVHL